jgi:hypothetical protein
MGALEGSSSSYISALTLNFVMWGGLLLAGASYPKEHQNLSPEFHQYM